MKLVTYEDKIFVVDEGVFEPNKHAFFLCNHIVANENDVALDLGTGTGFFAVVLASNVREVVATDIDLRAVRNAKKNVAINGLEDKVEILQGDMFEPVKGRKFDLIIGTLPQMPTPEWKTKENLVSIANDGGLKGRELIDKFVGEVGKYLSRRGRLYLLHFSFLDSYKTIKMLKEKDLSASVSASLEIQPGRLTLERFDHIRRLGYKLDWNNRTGNYILKIDVIAAIKV